MAFFLAIGVGLVACPLASYVFPSLFPQNLFRSTSHLHPNPGDIITPQLSTLIENTLAHEKIMGLSVAIVSKRGEPAFHAWGHRTEDGDEVTPDTLFHVASTSKAFCATALGILIDDFARGNNVTVLPHGVGSLTWDTRLCDVLPELMFMNARTSEQATLRDVLAHLSGLPRHDASYGPADVPQEVIKRLRYLKPTFELRERWSYNNIMYVVAAHIVATYAGQSYTSFVQDRIFTPLGMTSSTFSPATAEASGNFSQGWTREGRRVPECFDEDSASLMAGPGGVISNAVDMARWTKTWIHKGTYDDKSIFPAFVYRDATHSYADISTGHPIDKTRSTVGYGMGWVRSLYRGHCMLFHTGSLPGFSTLVAFLPSDEIGVTLLANGGSKVRPLMQILDWIVGSALHLTNPLTSGSPSPSHNTRRPTTVPDPWNATLAVSLDALAGVYTNPGYGALAFCGPSTTSPYCTRVRSDFGIIDDAQGQRKPGFGNANDLLAAWPRVWSSHVRMRRRWGSDVEFDVWSTRLYLSGFGRDKTPFETGEGFGMKGVAEFVVEEGWAVGFGLWMEGLVGWSMDPVELTHRGEEVKKRADVWFDRVV